MAPLLDAEDEARARNLLDEIDGHSFNRFEWAVTRLLVLLVDALSKDTRP